MVQIHPQARTTPAVRAEIARSIEPASVVAKRYGISDETVRKWRKRGEQLRLSWSCAGWVSVFIGRLSLSDEIPCWRDFQWGLPNSRQPLVFFQVRGW